MNETDTLDVAAYYEATWHTILTIAKESYGMGHHMATIYAWVLFGNMMSENYRKMEH